MQSDLPAKLVTKGESNVTFPVNGREDGTGYFSPVNRTSEYGLVLIQQWWGLNQSLNTTADRFAERGYQVLVPDIYRGKVAKNREEAGHLMTGLDWAGAVADCGGAKAFLQSQKCKKVGILGFCMGGALSISAASYIPGFDACAPFYGIPDLSKIPIKNLTCRFQGHFGELDPIKPFSDPESAKNLVKILHQHNPTAEVIIWPNSNHAFMNQDSPNFNPDTYKLALDKVSTFFK